MPIIPVTPDPTWAEIEAGLEAAATTSQNAGRAQRASQADEKRARAATEKHRDDQRAADQNFDQWLAAARRKAYSAP